MVIGEKPLIDVERAEEALKRAQERIAAAPGEGDLERALASIRKSQARMKVARRPRRGMGDSGAGAAPGR